MSLSDNFLFIWPLQVPCFHGLRGRPVCLRLASFHYNIQIAYNEISIRTLASIILTCRYHISLYLLCFSLYTSLPSVLPLCQRLWLVEFLTFCNFFFVHLLWSFHMIFFLSLKFIKKLLLPANYIKKNNVRIIGYLRKISKLIYYCTRVKPNAINMYMWVKNVTFPRQ